MQPRNAFNATLDKYKIRALDIANKTGLSESYISKYRSGKAGNIGHETLIRMVKTFPPEAQFHFFFLCMAADSEEEQDQPLACT